MILQDSDKYIELEAGGKQALVHVKRSARARNISIRINIKGKVELVVPLRVSVNRAKSFLLEKASWLGKRLSEVQKHSHTDNSSIPLFGVQHLIKQINCDRRSVVVKENNIIEVLSHPDLVELTLLRFLKDIFLKEVEETVQQKAGRNGLEYKRIRLTKGSSKWGSCSLDGTLSFNWRLVFAPKNVIEYLVAHELAHLKERNHGPRFWRLVDEIYAENKPAKKWLKQDGRALHSILVNHK